MVDTDFPDQIFCPDASWAVETLLTPLAFPKEDAASVELFETHISWVFLVGRHAYKIKKPIKTPFLDYSSIEKRKGHCENEIRIGRRFARGLYLGVEPVVTRHGHVSVGGSGTPVDYAVKMNRFQTGNLLSERLVSGGLSVDQVHQLAQRMAKTHQYAIHLGPRTSGQCIGNCQQVYQDALDNLDALGNLDSLNSEASSSQSAKLRDLAEWSHEFFSEHRQLFQHRIANGFIRECHGDLHLANIVEIDGRFVPYDPIEFNERFRWIDVLSDISFATMDFAAIGRPDLAHSFINSYLEATGDYESLPVLRWYLVYRSLVRAKTSMVRLGQSGTTPVERRNALRDCSHQIDLATDFSRRHQPRMWITHGVSGSGKTTASEHIVQMHGTIRLRSDIERKRHFGVPPTEHPKGVVRKSLYSDDATRATYVRLKRLTREILRAGYNVVIDATFLKSADRREFRTLAKQQQAVFTIVDCHACERTLRKRILGRLVDNSDPSDADLAVLNQQLAAIDPLNDSEKALAISSDSTPIRIRSNSA